MLDKKQVRRKLEPTAPDSMRGKLDTRLILWSKLPEVTSDS